jgi:hypothetical protein
MPHRTVDGRRLRRRQSVLRVTRCVCQTRTMCAVVARVQCRRVLASSTCVRCVCNMCVLRWRAAQRPVLVRACGAACGVALRVGRARRCAVATGATGVSHVAQIQVSTTAHTCGVGPLVCVCVCGLCRARVPVSAPHPTLHPPATNNSESTEHAGPTRRSAVAVST